MKRRRPGELKNLMLRELAKRQPHEWVNGAVLAADTSMHIGCIGAVSLQLRGLVETKKGTAGGYRLTARGRRLANGKGELC